jgi:hypothetical protein
MMKLLLIFIFVLSSCSISRMKDNQVKLSTVRFFGGVHENKSWKENLNFKRVSWYYRITLFYDAILHRASKSSSFYNWFSKSEKEYFEDCSDVVVAILYSADSKRISHNMFTSQMEHQGYKEVSILDFSKSLQSHPSFEDWKLHRYKVVGYCLDRNKTKGDIKISFPSFFTITSRM